jgi:hypothetical protein
LEDAKLTNHDIYLTYIDFRNTFGFIDHARLLALMEDLGYPKDTGELTGNLYMNSTTSFHGNYFGATPLILITIGTIQGDTINPYLFIIFLDPLLRWLGKNNIEYHFKTSTITCNATTYVDDLVIITDKLSNK